MAAANSRLIASFLGPAMVAVGASEQVNPDLFRTGGVSYVYLTGVLFALTGLVIVRFHNVWTPSWPAFITLIGWFTLGGGLFRMFLPSIAQRSTPVGDPVVDGGMIVLGLFLTVMAWRRER